MATKKDSPVKTEHRRFPLKEGEERKAWTEEERKKYYAVRDRLAPVVKDLITPPPEEKKKDPLAEWLGIESD